MNTSKNSTTENSQSEQPSTTAQHRTLQTVLGVFIALVLSLFIALPYVVELIIVDMLEKQGADRVLIKDVDLNLFTGNFSIQGLEISTNNHPALKIEQFSITVPYWQALSNKATIEDLLLRDAVIPVVQLEDGSMVIGLPIPTGDQQSTEASDEQLASATEQEQEQEQESGFNIQDWQLSLENLLFKNVTVQLHSQQLNNAFEIKTFELKNLTSWSEAASHLTLLASITKLENPSDIQIEANNISLKTDQKLIFSPETSLPMIDLSGEFSLESSSLQYEQFSVNTQLENIALELRAGYDDNRPTPINWRVEKLQLTQLNTQFSDQNVEPPFSTDVEIQSLLVEKIDNQSPDEPTTISLTGSIDQHATVSLSGTATPLADQISADMKATVTSLELVPMSPYIESAIEYHTQSGKLTLDTEIKIKENQLDSNVGITLNNIKLAPASDEAAQKLTKQLTMPLDLMLSVLRDTDNNVQIDIPVNGDIDKPDFDINDVLEQAAAKATQYAALSFLKNALQPYTTMISVAEFAFDQGKALTALKLDPLLFQPQQVELSEDQTNYLSKIAELLQQRPELRVRFCGVGYTPMISVTADKGKSEGDNSSEKAKDETQQKEKADAFNRAKQLANVTKNELINQHGISGDRLFSCQPRTEQANAESTEDARVELLL
ncbi:MAG: DUF748 domain-containing protein [Pseudomonadales bacterium]|nr:DUF748 domain-containing protein [Pseudomonadales bacterium]